MPGGKKPDPQTSKLKGAVTRTKNRVDKLEGEYGARDVPQSSPHYPKIADARRAHKEALRAYTQHTKGGG
jgi:hypothetical protein